MPKRSPRRKSRRNPVLHGLTEQQIRFYWYYSKLGIGTQAAIAAGYSPARAHVTASELLHNRKAEKLLEEMREHWRAELVITPERIAENVAALAFADRAEVAKIVDGKLEVTDTDDLTPIARQLVTEYHQTETTVTIGEKTTTTTTLRLKMHSQLDALTLLARLAGLLKDSPFPVAPTGPDGKPAREPVAIYLPAPSKLITVGKEAKSA